MKEQHEIAKQLNTNLVRSTIAVLVEEYDSQKNIYKGRSTWDAPQIDNQVYITDNEGIISIGDIIEVQIETANTYDLFGVPKQNINAEQPVLVAI